MRRLVLPIALLATLLTAPQAAATTRPLVVQTFNIHHGEGPDGRLDLARVADEIRRSRADVVGLQEVDRHYGARSDHRDQAADLGAALGMEVVYGANLDLDPAEPGRPRRQYGTAVLSRHRVLSASNTPLPKGQPGEEQRGLLDVVISVHGLPVRVLNTHLQHTSSESRLRQAEAIAPRVTASREPVVLTGDLNATPEAPEITTLTALLADSHRGPGGATYPVEAPTKRIDYVLGGRPLRSEVLPTAASDHRPVRAFLLLGRAQ